LLRLRAERPRVAASATDASLIMVESPKKVAA
jgi:hypothetical protein